MLKMGGGKRTKLQRHLWRYEEVEVSFLNPGAPRRLLVPSLKTRRMKT